MPGHATAAIAAYPALASVPNPPASPSHDWGVLPNLFNPDEPTFTFLENVLDVVMALFPGRYIHVGGDEATKDQWKENGSAHVGTPVTNAQLVCSLWLENKNNDRPKRLINT